MSTDNEKVREKVRIPLAELKIGMFVEDVFSDKGVLLLSEGRSIESHQQILNLRNRGVSEIVVNVEKSIVKPTAESPTHSKEARERAQREAAYYAELPKAREVHEQTFECAKKLLDSVKSRSDFSVRAVTEAAECIAGSVERNPDALVSLTQVKGYDEYTYVHSVNVGILMSALAREFGYKGDALVEFGIGGLLHDIGKMKVPEAILNKPGKLTDAEFSIMKRHPEWGMEMLADKVVPDMARKAVGQHHERFGGGGYPLGVNGSRIHEAALICSVSDVYDALTSDRIYREAWTPQKALATIFQGCDSSFSRKYVERFTRHLGIYPVGSFIKLASGELAIVMRVDPGKLLMPAMLILFDENSKKLQNPIAFDLAEYEGTPVAEKRKILLSLSPKPYDINIGEYIGRKV
ncbi:MAG: HD-GYP domain-containing protein [Fibrobacteres bacterium]|nr:HD-GYP domain-containing protein [Fibrobacterota bacterium]